MKIETIVIACLSAFLTFLPLNARPKYSISYNDIGVVAGVSDPLNKGLGGDFVTGLTFGHFGEKGFGFRTGIQFVPTSPKFSDSVGIPFALSYRTGDRYGSGKWKSRAYSSYRNRRYYDDDNMARVTFGSFLMNLFNKSEFMAGITPGYVSGKYNKSSESSSSGYWRDSHTECDNHISLSVDAGLSLNYSLWKFDLKIMPAIHYNLTNNYNIITSEGGQGGVTNDTQPVKWFFSLCGGLVFNFQH